MFFTILGGIGFMVLIGGVVFAFTHPDKDLQEEIDEIEQHKKFVQKRRETFKK